MGGRNRSHSMPLGRLGKPAMRCLLAAYIPQKFELLEVVYIFWFNFERATIRYLKAWVMKLGRGEKS